MRYTCLQTVVSKVYDGILEGDEEILNLLTQLKDKEITCSMRVKTGPCHDYVRILEINQTEICWMIIKNGVSLRKKSKIDDIASIETNTSDEIMIKVKPNPNRWTALDVSDS